MRRSSPSSISSSASAWASVRGKPSSRSRPRCRRLRQPVADQADDDVVGHQVASRHDLLGLQPELGALAHRRAQHVAGGDVVHLALGHHPRGLSALARARRAHENQVERHCGLLQEALVAAHRAAATRSGAWCRWRRPPRSAPRCRPARGRGGLGEAAELDEQRRHHRHRRQERAPATVSRTSTDSRYWAVGLPGRMPGMKPPAFLRLSACSIELNTTPRRRT